jgi:hypothetical protein
LNDHHSVSVDQGLGSLIFNDSNFGLNMTQDFSIGGDLKFLTEHLFDSTPVFLSPIENRLLAEFAAAPKSGLP